MHLIIPKQIYGSKYGTTCHSISLLLCSTHALSHRPPFKKLTFFHKKVYRYFLNIPFLSQYIRTKYKLLAKFLVWYIITSWLVWAQIKCAVHVTQLKRTINLFQSEFTILIYTVVLVLLLTIWWVEKKTTETYIFRDKIFFTKIV